MKIETTAYVKDGKLLFRNRAFVEGYCIQSGLTEFEVTIEKKKKHRSIQQNRWYWAAIKIMADHTGYTSNEMHEVCKLKFLKVELVNEKTGEVFEYVRSTTDLTTTEFSNYMDEIRLFAAETFSLEIPLPNEQTAMDFTELG